MCLCVSLVVLIARIMHHNHRSLRAVRHPAIQWHRVQASQPAHQPNSLGLAGHLVVDVHLEYKRSGVWKARVVIQGFKDDKEELNGPGDHLGMTFFETEKGVYLMMEKYVDAMMVKLDLEPSQFRKVQSPISAEIKDDTPCNKVEATLLMMSTGMLRWLAFTGRPDLKYAHSRISQHMAKPTMGALQALHHCLCYCWFTKNPCLHQPRGSGLCPDEWELGRLRHARRPR